MNHLTACIAGLITLTGLAAAQTRPANWPTFGGDPQRTGWNKADARISKDNVKDLQLLWKLKLENQPKGPRPLTPPLILGNLISYRGFRELAILGVGSEVVYAVDADLGKVFWQRHLEYSTNEAQVTLSTAACPGGLTAMPAMPSAGRAAPAGRGGGGFGGGGSAWALSSDGRLHRLNTSTGDDIVQPVSVLPANAKTSALNMVDNVVYTMTGQECNGVPNAVWAINVTGEVPKVASFPLKGKDPVGLGGVAIGNDGTVYVQTSDALLGLSSPDLKLKQTFAVAGVTSPVVFPYPERDLIVTAGKDNRLYLLDPASPDTPLSRIAAEAPTGGLATWADPAGVRWVLSAGTNAVSAYKVQEQGVKPALVPAWVSRELSSPMPPVIANGLVFALSGGARATLYALDAETGKELYSSRNLLNAPVSRSGMTSANGRVYFATTDGTLYCFGIYMEH